MLFAAALLLVQAAIEPPPPPDQHVFDNEEAGGRALDSAMYCLASSVPKMNQPPTKAILNEMHSACRDETEKLKQELISVFITYPERIPMGLSAGDAANLYVSNLLDRFDYTFAGTQAH